MRHSITCPGLLHKGFAASYLIILCSVSKHQNFCEGIASLGVLFIYFVMLHRSGRVFHGWLTNQDLTFEILSFKQWQQAPPSPAYLFFLQRTHSWRELLWANGVSLVDLKLRHCNVFLHPSLSLRSIQSYWYLISSPVNFFLANICVALTSHSIL